MYNKIHNDFELLYLIGRGSYEAYEILIKKYEMLIRDFVKYLPNNFQTKDDYVQECNLCIHDAIKTFDVSKDVLFYSYLHLILKRKVARIWKYCYRETEINECMIRKVEINRQLMETNTIYETELIKMKHNVQYKQLYSELKIFDRLVLNEILIEKKSKEEFVKKYNTNIKRVYNTINKIKTKLENIISKDINN